MSATSKKVLFVLTSHDQKGDEASGFSLAELTHPYRVLTNAGYPVDFVSPMGGKTPIDPDSHDLDDGANAKFWNDPALRSAVEHTQRTADVNADDYAGVFFPGGFGAMWDLPDDVSSRNTARIYERGGIVGAVGHGPVALLNVKRADGAYLIKDMFIAAFTNDEERELGHGRAVPFVLTDRLTERGAHLDAAPNGTIKVCVSGRLVTGQNPASATRVGDAMLTMLQIRRTDPCLGTKSVSMSQTRLRALQTAHPAYCVLKLCECHRLLQARRVFILGG